MLTAQQQTEVTRAAEAAETIVSSHLQTIPDGALRFALALIQTEPAEVVLAVLPKELTAGLVGFAFVREAERRWGLNSAQEHGGHE